MLPLLFLLPMLLLSLRARLVRWSEEVQLLNGDEHGLNTDNRIDLESNE